MCTSNLKNWLAVSKNAKYIQTHLTTIVSNIYTIEMHPDMHPPPRKRKYVYKYLTIHHHNSQSWKQLSIKSRIDK